MHTKTGNTSRAKELILRCSTDRTSSSTRHQRASTLNKQKVFEKVIIGSLKGSTHSLGKDIVVATLSAAGFQVVDLGVDVSPERFVEAVVREKAQIIGISISVDETVPSLKGVVDRLRQKNLADEVKIVIGGPAVSERTRKTYGVDAYARDAGDCVSKVKLLLNSYKHKPKKR